MTLDPDCLKRLFLKAYENKTLLFTGIHMEDMFANRRENDTLFFAKVDELAARLRANNVPVTWCMMESEPLTKIEDNDRTFYYSDTDPLGDKRLSDYITSGRYTVNIVTGLSVNRCLRDYVSHVKKLGITPILVSDCTDLYSICARHLRGETLENLQANNENAYREKFNLACRVIERTWEQPVPPVLAQDIETWLGLKNPCSSMSICGL